MHCRKKPRQLQIVERFIFEIRAGLLQLLFVKQNISSWFIVSAPHRNLFQSLYIQP